MLKSSYYNAASLRKFIKEGRKGTFIYDKENGYVCNGYIALVADELVRAEVIKEFLTDKSFYWQNGSFMASKFDVAQFFKSGSNICQNTPYSFEMKYIEKGNKVLTLKVFLDGDHEIYIDKKYTDILNHEMLVKSEITTNGGSSGITFEYLGSLMAFMLPVRTPKEREYKIAKAV